MDVICEFMNLEDESDPAGLSSMLIKYKAE
jgi:hypothetical protein